MKRNLKSQAELLKRWSTDPGAKPEEALTPLVSICCIAFNHENFIAEALDGMLMQETDFPFEILIHDDASTDKTQDIIREYEQEYPSIIHPIYQTENQYSKRAGGGMNPQFNYPRARGKYIAICEGDDYWTDTGKLQKQVGFLEQHSEYVMSFHDARVIDKDGNLLKNHKLRPNNRCDKSSQDMLKGKMITMLSFVFRCKALNYPENYKSITNGDTLLVALLSQHGKAKFQGEIKPASYRVHKGGIHSLKDDKKKLYTAYKTYTFISGLDLEHASIADWQAVKYLYKIKKYDLGFFKNKIKNHRARWVLREGLVFYIENILGR